METYLSRSKSGGADTLLRQEQYKQNEKEAIDYLNSMLNANIIELHDDLKDGVLLCKWVICVCGCIMDRKRERENKGEGWKVLIVYTV